MNTQTPLITDSENIYKEYFREAGKLSKQAMEQKAKAGDMPGCAPVGYLNKTERGRKYVAVDEAKAQLVQETFELAAEGNLSLRKILKIVTEKGLTSRNGKTLGVSALWKILTNPFYMGLVTFNGEEYPGNHQPIITKEAFQKVLENLKCRAKRV